MSCQRHENTSTFTKMQQVYWEAKRVLKSSLGNKDDDCLISNDLELDTRLQLLQSADSSFSHLILILQKYNISLKNLKDAEESLSIVLQESGSLDATKAGKVMVISGKALSRISRKRSPVQCKVVKLISDIQTFQQTATVDAINTVARMERARQSYRSGLMWLKKESRNLDPEAFQRLKKFRKVQDHIKRLQTRFSKSKLETLQKIDLYLLSRSNLFSQSLVPYRIEFCKMTSSAVAKADYAIRSISTGSLYKFETLKELNEYDKQQDSKYVRISRQKNQKNIDPGVNSTNSEENIKDVCCQTNSDTSEKSGKIGGTSSNKDRQTNDKLIENADQLLIDFTTEIDDNYQNNITRNTVNACGKYSQDLQSINFDCYQNILQPKSEVNTTSVKDSQDQQSIKLDCYQYVNQFKFQAGDFSYLKEEMEIGEDFFCFEKETPEQDNSDLKFWTLMENWKNENVLSSSSFKEFPKSRFEIITQNQLLSQFDPLSLERSQVVNEFEDSC